MARLHWKAPESMMLQPLAWCSTSSVGPLRIDEGPLACLRAWWPRFMAWSFVAATSRAATRLRMGLLPELLGLSACLPTPEQGLKRALEEGL